MWTNWLSGRTKDAPARIGSKRKKTRIKKMNYAAFVAQKLSRHVPTGIAQVPPLHDGLFAFQKDVVSWALRKGRAAIFADTGLGKTRMQLEWAKHIGGDVLILAPLAVAAQTAREGKALGLSVQVCRENEDIKPGINITNYDRLHKFDGSRFRGVVLDESSIIKHHDAKTFAQLLEVFEKTPFKLCATATPSPNDYTELGTHAQFLGVCSQSEMLSEFFVHDGGDTSSWRLKKHARGVFWQWVASWAALIRKPSDLGYDNTGYDLPPLSVSHHIIEADKQQTKEAGFLFAQEASTLQERRGARRASIEARVAAAAKIANAEKGEPWIIWCDLNTESELLTKAINGAVEVKGSDDTEHKEQALLGFCEGRIRALVTKPKIAGFGLNMQRCARMIFVGVTDSFESYYQAIRRCYRFGQTRPVEVHIFASELEGQVVRNLERKEKDAMAMAEELSIWTRDAVRAEVKGSTRQTNEYAPKKPIQKPAWLHTELS